MHAACDKNPVSSTSAPRRRRGLLNFPVALGRLIEVPAPKTDNRYCSSRRAAAFINNRVEMITAVQYCTVPLGDAITRGRLVAISGAERMSDSDGVDLRGMLLSHLEKMASSHLLPDELCFRSNSIPWRHVAREAKHVLLPCFFRPR